MSVIIKGMDMPKTCKDCLISGNAWNCLVTGKPYIWGSTTRPSDCPLVEIPKGTRLINANFLSESIELAKHQCILDQRDYANAFRNASEDLSTEWWCVENMIDTAPTVFEEDESWKKLK